MNFLLTSFFHELREPLPLLPSRGLVLDNARTDEELAHVSMLLERASTMHGTHVSMLPGLAVHVSWPPGLDDARARALASVADDELPAEAARELLSEIVKAASREHVICRFDDEGSYKALRQVQEGLPPNSFVMLGDEDPLIVRSREAFELGHLLALVASDESAEGSLRDTFILDHTPEWSVELGEHLTLALVSRCIISRDRPGTTGYAFADLRHYATRLEAVGELLDRRLRTSDPHDPLLYAGQLLAIASGTRDGRIRLVNLVALLELLLTRNPDSSRFNVEDSISRQFVLKVGVALHQTVPALDLESTRRTLKDLYGIRSAIAHGDFGRLNKQLLKSGFAEREDDDYGTSPAAIALDRACEFSYRCARATVGLSLQDPGLVSYLKTN